MDQSKWPLISSETEAKKTRTIKLGEPKCKKLTRNKKQQQQNYWISRSGLQSPDKTKAILNSKNSSYSLSTSEFDVSVQRYV